MGFLGVYKAIYDYVPQGESELAISEGDTLFVLEKSGEDDWWKAKKAASGEDDDEPVGLIPNNYIEEAQPTHQARALYDYTRQTDEELSFTEDAKLEVFDMSDPDWILVGLDGEYGFAPANYIEIQDEVPVTAAPAPTPALPKRPTIVEEEEEPQHEPEPARSPAPNPAAALAGIMGGRQSSASTTVYKPQYTPEESDEEEPPTPTLPARPVSQPHTTDTYSPRSPISPGVVASPPYSRVSHRGSDEHASRAPAGFHLYNVNEMVEIMGKKKKIPTILGINNATGVIMIAPDKAENGAEQRWTAEKMQHYSIEGKHIFIELVRPSKSIDFHAGAKDTAQEIISALGELAGAVRAGGALHEVWDAASGKSQKRGQVLYDFEAQGEDEVTVAVGDEVIVIDDTKSEEWWQVRRLRNGKEGVVPSSYIEITGTVQPTSSTSGINAGRSTVEQNRLEEERLAKESLKAARREEERGSEVGPGMKLPERGSSLSARGNSNSIVQQHSKRENSRSDPSRSKSKPDPSKVRTWTDRSDTFSVEAQFLALKDGKFNLHKMNGVKIAVPIVKMSLADLEYVERLTGVSLDEDKPLSAVKKQRTQASNGRSSGSSPGVGASIERQQKPEYDWFQFFLSCEVAVGLCERYAQTFQKDSMDESVLPDVDATVLRTLGLREGDIIKVMRFLDKKFGRQGAKRNVSFGGEEVIDGEGSGGLFSGPGGTLRNNTRKGRPAPAVQTNDVVDPKAFSQDSPATSKSDAVATPLASAPIPAQKDVQRSGFDDDAWDVKPSKQPQQPQEAPKPAAQPAPAPAPAPAPQQPSITGSMQELSLLSQPLEPVKAQPAAAPQPQIPQQQQAPQQVPQPTGATPSFFSGIGNQQTGLPQFRPQNFAQQQQQANIARQRPTPPQFNQSQSGLLPPLPPSRPLSAPQNQSSFAPPPLQPQMTGIQNSSGYQPQIAPPGQSLNDLNQQKLQQQYTAQQQQMQPQMTGYGGQQMMPQPTGFGQFNNNQQQPNGFQPQQFQPQQTGFQQQNFMNGQAPGASPFADPRSQQFSPIQQQPTGFQSSFPTQQYPQQTGVNAFLPPALQPQQTGMNGFGGQGFGQPPPPVPPMPQQAAAPLLPQKTGPPPPVRFGMTGDTKKLMPQATGRKANLSQATPQNPFGF